MFLVEGHPGTGKTTLSFQFLLEGVAKGESTLYITLSETKGEVDAVARSHGWDISKIHTLDLSAAEEALGLADAQTMFDPSDVEFRATTKAIMDMVERVSPNRVVFDSLSELTFLARDALAFRRELLLLKRALMKRGATVLLVSDGTAPSADRHLHSLAHGVLELEEMAPEYGPERRRLRVRKLRGSSFRGGFHDFAIRHGGLEVYPRLIAAEHGVPFSSEPLASGNANLDTMLGGGLSRGASTLFMGPAGSGKSTMLSVFAHASVERGEKAALFLFDEEADSLLRRAEAVGLPLRAHLDSGALTIEQIDPAQLSPGELVHQIRTEVETRGARFVGLDSLNGYVFAMPEERFLTVHLHQLLSYLAKYGVATAMVMAQSGMVGPMTTPADVTYVADAVVLFRFFEAEGEVRRAVSMLKKRSGPHGSAIRELEFGDGAMHLSEPLVSFQGVLTGVPKLSDPRRPGGEDPFP